MFQIFCDFDGTITTRDSIVFLTERFGEGVAFREQILEQIKSGEITVFEAIERELATVKISWEEAVEALSAEVAVDPTFPEFVQWCRRRGHSLSVVSSGLEPVVSLFVGQYGLPVYAHPVEITPDGWIYRKREEFEKPRLLAAARGSGTPIVYIGDGTSDFAVVAHVDILFATSYLAEYCRERGFPFEAFDSFDDVSARLDRLTA